MTERVCIEGVEEVPEAAREQINDAIHGILREDHATHAEVVYWEEA